MSRRHTAPSSSAEELLNTLGQLTGRILERIKMQQARVEPAAALQRHTLGAALPAVRGLRVAGRYAPARDGLDIGGDWYDGTALVTVVATRSTPGLLFLVSPLLIWAAFRFQLAGAAP